MSEGHNRQISVSAVEAQLKAERLMESSERRNKSRGSSAAQFKRTIAAFFNAISQGRVDEVETLLEDGVVNMTDRYLGRTPLLSACFWTKEDVVALLLKQNDVDINAKDEKRQYIRL